MFIIVSYDIALDKTRNKLAKIMRSFGDRVQFSVFECNMEAEEYDRMKRKLRTLPLETGDSVRIYILCTGCKNKIEIIGDGTVSEDPEIIIV